MKKTVTYKNEKIKVNFEKRAKEYCKNMKMKLEDVSGDMFIASVIGKRKVGNLDGRHYSKWDVIKHRSAFVFQIMKDNDVVTIFNYLGGKYHNPTTRFIFTSLIIQQVKKHRIYEKDLSFFDELTNDSTLP